MITLFSAADINRVLTSKKLDLLLNWSQSEAGQDITVLWTVMHSLFDAQSAIEEEKKRSNSIVSDFKSEGKKQFESANWWVIFTSSPKMHFYSKTVCILIERPKWTKKWLTAICRLRVQNFHRVRMNRKPLLRKLQLQCWMILLLTVSSVDDLSWDPTNEQKFCDFHNWNLSAASSCSGAEKSFE